MKITIGHLFYDLLNLYGESGNIIALKHALEMQGIEVLVKEISITNELELDELDVIYMGAGTEKNIELCCKYMNRYKEDVFKAIMDNKFFFITGNAIEIFGKHIQEGTDKLETLGVFDYYTQRTNKRIVSECVFSFEEIEDKILGFENHQGEIVGVDSPLFTVIKGIGSFKDSKQEGIYEKNFYGTYILGPILARNPMLLKNICEKLILSKDEEFEFKPFDFEIEKIAHDRFLQKCQ